MKVYNCSDPGENPIPFWLSQKAYSVVPEEKTEDSKPDSGKVPELPTFSYKNKDFFPEFCRPKHI